MLNETIKELLLKNEFIGVATCNIAARPNIAPKLLLKCENNFLYLVDYVFGRTFENLKINPRVSLTVMDKETLTGYQLNGSVKIIQSGKEFNKSLSELREKQISLSSKRIVEGIYRGKTHENFEASFPDKVAIFKVKIEEIVKIFTSGNLKKEKI
jgi:nitroimidazol reductase NimA-like FMN-containing flavoprotein (pyridoxamine 5'-phosphate oxidase superfamily)